MMVARSVRAFFFDLDDTLVDFEAARQAALHDLAAELAARIPHRSEAQVLETRGRIVAERNRRSGFPQNDDLSRARARVWAELLADLGAAGCADPAALVERHDVLTRRRLQFYPDSDAALRWAAERFETVGVITNGPSDVQWGEVRAVGLHHRVDRVIVAGDVGAYKPDPRIFAAAIHGLGVPAGHCAYVGNSLDHDVVGALAAGWHALWLDRSRAPRPPDAPHPTATITTLAELPEIFD